ncbi:formyl transferase [Candidatus Tenderia electrophaga]|jgi:methionyl-tRNA formyltransferase|uniref:Formyl transferase n=1 Tax=Candidatus Tenderia electrophaga TaxID=1748243 RepID=A0A0S2TC06_9GAMM|nr:formyl transferase [Candidatus Tenderia electrophaga]
MRIAFIGCVEFSAAALTMLLDHPQAQVVGVVTRSQSNLNADFRDLSPLAERAGCPVFLSDGRDQDQMAAWLRERKPEVVYCLGWSKLLSADVLAVAPKGVVGYHPAALPYNRGRHPIIWALALGLEQTASTFFLMDESADSGDILSQQAVAIAAEDDAGSLYHKLIDTALPQLRQLTTALANGNAERIPQDPSQANYWRKRCAADGRIDWRMSAQGIHNLVRALARPYPGAHCDYAGREVKLWRVRPVATAAVNLEPGKVLQVNDGRLLVKCGAAAVEVIEHEFDPLPREGSYL